jgi:hypothetical protein
MASLKLIDPRMLLGHRVTQLPRYLLAEAGEVPYQVENLIAFGVEHVGHLAVVLDERLIRRRFQGFDKVDEVLHRFAI